MKVNHTLKIYNINKMVEKILSENKFQTTKLNFEQ